MCHRDRGYDMKQKIRLDYSQWALAGAITACIVASSSRLSNHQLWQDITIIISGVVIGIIGLLLALNWGGITERYTIPIKRLHPKKPPRSWHTILFRIGGALLSLEALAAIVSNILWIMALSNSPR